jgi:type IV secretory pathway VirB10-like protein
MTSAVNSIEPALPTPAPAGVTQEQSRPIVSVNSGPRPKSPLAFWLLMSFGGIVVIALIALLISRLNVREALIPGGNQVATKQPGTPVDPPESLRRPFDSSVPVTSAPAAPQVSLSDVGAGYGTAGCVPRPIRDPNGNPITGSDGKPLIVNCNGTSVPVAATPTVSLAGLPPTGAGLPATTPTAAPANAPANRYGGPVNNELPVRAPNPGELPAEAREALEVLRRAEAGQQAAGAAGAGAAQASGGLRLEGFGTQAAAAAPPAAAATSSAAGVNSRILSRVASVEETPRHMAKPLERAKWVALRGSQVDCNLTLAYVSEIAGEAHCVVARDVLGQDGTTVLIDRGSIANGSFQAVNALGERRAYVIWERLVTPPGVVVTLASKGTDALGSTGVPAEVDNRWFDRVGIALAISLVKDISSAIPARRAASGSQFVASSQEFADQVLAQTVAIRPTLYVKQGSAASIVLQGDLDFSGVYALKR